MKSRAISKVVQTRFGALGALLLVAMTVAAGFGATPADGVAVAIVYDTSSSMRQKVPGTGGKLTPKHVIASRALEGVVDRLQRAASSPTARTRVEAALVVFQGDHAEYAVQPGPFRAEPFRAWLSSHDQLQHGTPLGDAVRLAGEAVLASPLARKHMVVITDGINTKGSDPTVTIPNLLREAEAHKTSLGIHFVAFDVKADVFAGVKRLGGTVVSAADEKQLNSQLEFILAKKILLEDEELPAATQKPN